MYFLILFFSLIKVESENRKNFKNQPIESDGKEYKCQPKKIINLNNMKPKRKNKFIS